MPLGAFKAALMGTAGVSTGDVVLHSTQTASGSASLAFTSGLTSTYSSYIFKFYHIHPATDGGNGLVFQVSTDGGSNYNITTTTSYFRAHVSESGSDSSLTAETTHDQGGATAYQALTTNIGNDNDQNCSGELHLFDPSSTTYVKHFYSRANSVQSNDYTSNDYVAGYFDTTSAVNAISFKMGSGNIDAGKIKMWGVK